MVISIKKVQERALKKGDLVHAVRRSMILTQKSKGTFEPKWEGPYVIGKVYSKGAYVVLTVEGERCTMTINGKFLKRYYPNSILDSVSLFFIR